MNRLAKAEWHRIRHSGHFLGWIAGICGILVVLQLTMTEKNVFSLTMKEALPVFGDVILFVIQLFLPALVTVMAASGYSKKMAYYEVMAGNRICSMICSKLLVDGVFVAIVTFVTSLVIPVIVYMKNGMGGATDVILRFLLLLVVILHVCFVAVLFATTFRHIAASVVAFIRFAVMDTLAMVLVKLLCEDMHHAQRLTGVEWFVQGQVTCLFYDDITSHFVFAIFGSMIVECGFLYLFSYVGMKKKWYYSQ